MHSESDNTEFIIYDNTNEVKEKLFSCFFIGTRLDWKHHWEVVILSLIVFIYCIINPSPGGSNIDFSNGIKNHKATINLIDKKDSKCFQYATTVALNDEEIKKRPKN